MTLPKPIPVLMGKTAGEFEKRIKRGPTEKQKRILAEAEQVYAAMQRRVPAKERRKQK